ncbi:MAG TPA: phage Gp37/Gp68 family protein [Blastocatellia bacterium]|nr:phage Gp37/Gp68 family protein [Blastocatellia bacterium]
MARKTNIEWTDMTWNPVTGCTKISPGCKHCYAETMSKRLKQMGADRYRNGFKVTLHDDLVDLPTRWKRPRMVFVNSMSDLFQGEVPLEFIRRVFETMRECPQHQFQVLTKRADRLLEVSPQLNWAANIWMGVSVENQDYAYRSEVLRRVPAAIRFLSVEPLLGPIDRLPLEGIHWVIVGGESGPGAREMRPEWVEAIYCQCQTRGVPFFFKQWGGVQKHRTGRELFGQTFDELPAAFSA